MNSETVGYKQATVAPAKTFVNRDASQTRLIAGVGVPDSPLITAVIEHAQRLSEPYLFNHAMRSWLFAEAIGGLKGIDYDREVVAIGTILHDIGLTASVSGPNRFEVNGADAALSFIKGKGLSGRRAQRAERKQNQTGKIRCRLREGQRRSSASAGQLSQNCEHFCDH